MMLIMVAPLTLTTFAELPDSSRELVAAGGIAEKLSFKSSDMKSGVRKGWSTVSHDAAAYAMADPDDPDNTVVKLSYDEGTGQFSGVTTRVNLESDKYYQVSIDFKITGETDNFGMRFAPRGTNFIFDHSFSGNKAKWTDIQGRDGWKNYTFYYYIPNGSSNTDRLELWFNTDKSLDNYVLIDNLSVREAELAVPGFNSFIEGESLDLTTMVYSEGDKFNLQDMVWFTNETWKWTNNHQFVWDPQKKVDGKLNPVGETLEYTIYVPEDGDYDITVNQTTAGDFAIVQYYFNDVKTGDEVDAYAPSVQKTGDITFEDVALVEGENTVKIEIVGRNSKGSSAFLYGLDYIKIEKDGLDDIEPVFDQDFGENLLPTGDFEGFLVLDKVPNGNFNSIVELIEIPLPDPVDQWGWATWFGDSRGRYILDPEDSNNVVLKLGKEPGRPAFSSLSKFLGLPLGHYKISFDFQIHGETDNFAVFFELRPEIKIMTGDGLIEDNIMPIEGKEGWYHFEASDFNAHFAHLRMHFNTHDSENNYVLIDNLEVTKNDYYIPGFYEGEFLDFSDMVLSDGEVDTQYMDWVDGGAAWSNKAQMIWRDKGGDNPSKLKEGSTLEYKIHVAEAGEYELKINHVINHDFGIVTYEVNGEAVDGQFNFFTTDGLTTRLDSLGVFDLVEGENTIKVTMVSKGDENHPDANYLYAVDYILLENDDLGDLADREVTITPSEDNLAQYGDFEFINKEDLVEETPIPDTPGVGPLGGYFTPEDVSRPYITYIDNQGALRFRYEDGKGAISAFRKEIDFAAAGKHTLSLNVKYSEDVKNMGFRLYDSHIEGYNYLVYLLKDGKQIGTWKAIEGKEGWYTVTVEIAVESKYANLFELFVDTQEDEDNVVYVDNLSIRYKNQPTKMYTSNTLRDGPFDLFEEGTKFDNIRRSGWLAVEGANVGVIRKIGDNKTLVLAKGDKASTKANLEISPRINPGAVIQLEYDFHYTYTGEGTPVVKSSLVGEKGEYYVIDLHNIFDGKFTQGSTSEYYVVNVESSERGEGWQRVTVQLPLTEAIMADVDSITWEFASNKDGDALHIDNVAIYIVSNPVKTETQPPVDPDPVDPVDPVDPTPEQPKEKGNLTALWITLGTVAGIGIGGGTVFLLSKRKLG